MYVCVYVKSANEISFFCKGKCRSRSIMLSLGIKYSVRDVISDVNYCA